MVGFEEDFPFETEYTRAGKPIEYTAHLLRVCDGLDARVDVSFKPRPGRPNFGDVGVSIGSDCPVAFSEVIRRFDLVDALKLYDGVDPN
jgi:hypothetical protein